MALLWEMFYVRTKGSPFMLRFDCLSNSFDRREEEAPSVCNAPGFRKTFLYFSYGSSRGKIPFLIFQPGRGSRAQPYPAIAVMNNFPISGSFPLV
ncbi:hypothetical protein T02_12505 [Trichinella nativa]|uniref:Uncharacterized protein n=1 Tax=Trichinella nativa TaxID=6335 RepID=A0A0V1LAB2_9BILA|nr:hypothetical protein T02_12505 [Trichinella nativa]